MYEGQPYPYVLVLGRGIISPQKKTKEWGESQGRKDASPAQKMIYHT
jgi:hypothetical protein